MSASLKTVEATVSEEGIVTLAEHVTGPCKAFLTLLIEEPTPNATTLEAMNEPSEGLQRYKTASQAKAALGI